jgi:tetratricopeptide (TPR) repeat protein
MQPDTSTTYLKQGQYLQRQGRLTEAEVAYRQAIELNPIFSGSFRYLGEVLALQGKLDQAVEAYQRAKELNPKASSGHQRLGEVFLQLNKLEDAIACFQTAIQINPDFSWAYNGLGECWSLKGNRENAIAAYQKAVKLNPDSDTFRHNLEKVLAEPDKLYQTPEVNSERKYKIYDCFAFFNELDILRIRIEELKDVVDKFILVEATKTFSGNPKPLYYQEFIHEFAEYQDRIIHYVVDDMPEVINGDRWPLDIHQKDCIIRPLRLIECDDEDIILISDVDEIPRKEKIRDAINLLSDKDFVIFTHDMYHYHLDNFKSHWWCGTVACKYKDFKVRTTNQVRRSDEGYWSPNWKSGDIRKDGFQHPYIEKGGWHLSYFGGVNTRRYKVQSFAHAEGDNSKEKGIPLINFDVARPTHDEESLGKYYHDLRDVEGKDIPNYLKNNIRQYRHFLKPKATQMVLDHADLHLKLASDIYKKNLDIAVNLWCCAMQLNPETGKKKSFLSELSPVDYFIISPQQLFNRSGQLIQNENGYQLVSCAEDHQIVSFGPYISVPDGVYRVKIDVEMDAVDVKETNNHQIVGFKFDMVTDIGNTFLWEENVYINETQLEFYVELRDANKLEVRFFSTGQRFAINSIELALLYPLEFNKQT